MKDTPKEWEISRKFVSRENPLRSPVWLPFYSQISLQGQFYNLIQHLIQGSLNIVNRIYAIMHNFLKFLHFFKGKREREGRGLPLVACRLMKILLLHPAWPLGLHQQQLASSLPIALKKIEIKHEIYLLNVAKIHETNCGLKHNIQRKFELHHIKLRGR